MRTVVRATARSETRMKQKILDELQLSVAIVLSREEVVPRFRVMTPEGDWTVFVQLPDDVRER